MIVNCWFAVVVVSSLHFLICLFFFFRNIQCFWVLSLWRLVLGIYWEHPLPSNRQHLSYDVCLEVRGEIIRTVLLYCILKLCTVINTLRRAVLTVLWIGFCHTGPISLCVDLFVFVCICVFFVSYCIVVVSLWARWVYLMGLKPNPLDLSSFSALTLLVGSFDL